MNAVVYLFFHIIIANFIISLGLFTIFTIPPIPFHSHHRVNALQICRARLAASVQLCVSGRAAGRVLAFAIFHVQTDGIAPGHDRMCRQLVTPLRQCRVVVLANVVGAVVAGRAVHVVGEAVLHGHRVAAEGEHVLGAAVHRPCGAHGGPTARHIRRIVLQRTIADDSPQLVK